MITAIDDTAIASADGLTAVMQSYSEGDSVQVMWKDSGGKTHHATVTLASR